MLGVQPALGRNFAADEGRPGSPKVVIIGDGVWRRRFGAARDVLGRTLTLDDNPYTIVGVMPRRFSLLGGSSRSDALWVPVDAAHPGPEARPQFYGLGRLARGVAFEAVQDRANVLADEYQKARPLERTWGLGIRRKGVSFVAAGTRTVLLVLLGASGCVLLIACANVSNLFLARAAAREREMAVRSALGAGRGRLIRGVLAETVLIALAGGLLGVACARWGVEAALAVAPINLATRATTTIEIDGRVLAAAFLLTLAAGVVVGLVPALRGSRPHLDLALRAAGPNASPRRAFSMSGALVVVEVALALVLLVGATLLMRTFANLHAIDPGFELHGLVSVRAALRSPRYPSDASRLAFLTAATARLRALPGVSGLTVTSDVPPPGVGTFSWGVEADNGTTDGNGWVARNSVSPDFFRVLRIPLREGRGFSSGDAADAIVVSRALADRFWPGASAVGHRLRFGPAQEWLTIVGVTSNVAMWAGDTRVSSQLYAPLLMDGRTAAPRSFTITIRTGRVRADAAAAKQQIWSVDSNLTLEAPTILDEQWDNVFGRQRFAVRLMGAFAAIALALAAAGIFAVLSQTVSQRTREIGVRVALGAAPGDVFRMIVAHGLALTLAGVAVGLAGAAAAVRVLRTLLYEVSPYDPSSFAIVTAAMIAIALAACWLPTRRALGVEPAIALRIE